MKLEQIKDWLKQFLPPGTAIAVGHIDGNLEKFVGVYNARAPGKQRVCIGGPPQTAFQEKKVSILIHWTKDASETEAAAKALWDQMYAKANFDMCGVRVYMMDPGAEPIPVGRDARGVAEYVIEATITHERIE